MSGKYEPKVPVHLDPPKDGPISVEELAKANGELPLHDPSHVRRRGRQKKARFARSPLDMSRG